MKVFPALVAVIVLVACGLLHGAWTARWSNSGDLATAVARLDAVPKNLGDWESRAQVLDDRSLHIGGIAGYVLRSFQNRNTGERLTVLLLCGRPGAIAVHTPDVCYAAAGYTSGEPSQQTIVSPGDPDKPAAFWDCTMSRDNLAGSSKLHIFWSWSATGPWLAPANARVTFARAPFLYKLYVIRDASAATSPVGDAGTVAFIRQFLPVLQSVLFDSPGPTSSPHPST